MCMYMQNKREQTMTCMYAHLLRMQEGALIRTVLGGCLKQSFCIVPAWHGWLLDKQIAQIGLPLCCNEGDLIASCHVLGYAPG